LARRGRVAADGAGAALLQFGGGVAALRGQWPAVGKRQPREIFVGDLNIEKRSGTALCDPHRPAFFAGARNVFTAFTRTLPIPNPLTV